MCTAYKNPISNLMLDRRVLKTKEKLTEHRLFLPQKVVWHEVWTRDLPKMDESLDLEVVRLFSKVYAFYEDEGHVIMDCPFVCFHIKANTPKHV